MEHSNLSVRGCYPDLTPNTHNLFTRKYVAARGENEQLDLESSRVKHHVSSQCLNLFV